MYMFCEASVQKGKEWNKTHLYKMELGILCGYFSLTADDDIHIYRVQK